ncbi:MAG TPA: hypothetical protein VNP90_04680 [Actinomycetota bacterium]|nr:hypothetical protein [Actinomycetota bacterium]
MDPLDQRAPGGRFETFDVNERFVVVRDDDGYGVWRLEELDEGEPIERFADDERGYEAARSRYRELTTDARRVVWLGRLKWVVLVSAVVWTVSGALTGVLLFEVSSFEQQGLFQELFRWSQVVNVTAQPATLGGFALYVIIWLENRRRH